MPSIECKWGRFTRLTGKQVWKRLIRLVVRSAAGNKMLWLWDVEAVFRADYINSYIQYAAGLKAGSYTGSLSEQKIESPYFSCVTLLFLWEDWGSLHLLTYFWSASCMNDPLLFKYETLHKPSWMCVCGLSLVLYIALCLLLMRLKCGYEGAVWWN